MATKQRKTRKHNDIALAKARSHPIRIKLLNALVPGRVASPNELSKEVGLDLSVVSYHVRKLLEFDCIELVDTKPVRGAVEHFYSAKAPAVSGDVSEALSAASSLKLDKEGWKEVNKEVDALKKRIDAIGAKSVKRLRGASADEAIDARLVVALLEGKP